GQAAAMNAGCARASGRCVMFLDADDVLVPGACARALAALDADLGVGHVHFPMQVVDGEGIPTGATVPDDPRRLPAGDLVDALRDHPDDIPWQPTSGNAYRATTLATLLPIPEAPYRISADHYLNNLSALAGRVAVVPEPGA